MATTWDEVEEYRKNICNNDEYIIHQKQFCIPDAMMHNFNYNQTNNTNGKLTITLNPHGMSKLIQNGKTQLPRYATDVNWSGLCVWRSMQYGRVEFILCCMGGYNPITQFSAHNLSFGMQSFTISTDDVKIHAQMCTHLRCRKS